MANTSIVGLANAYNAKSTTRKLFWMFIFTGFLVWYVKHVHF
jgi:hypothetical protein